jgi:hypothetical protein
LPVAGAELSWSRRRRSKCIDADAAQDFAQNLDTFAAQDRLVDPSASPLPE